MKFIELQTYVPKLLNCGTAIHLFSSPGRGKSTFMKDLIRYLSNRDGFEWGLSIAFLATYTPTDMVGLLFKGQREWCGETVAVSDPTLPPWMITTEGKPTWAYKRGILFLDEYGQGESDVKRAARELKLNKRLGPWTLGGPNTDGWSVVAASNYTTDRSGVTKSFDFDINSEIQINVTDDLESWMIWADRNNVSHVTKHFVSQHPDIVFSKGVPEKQGPWCTPRSAVKNDRMLAALADDTGAFPDDAQALELSSGIIGQAAAEQFFISVRLDREAPKYEEIVAAPMKAKLPTKLDAQMLTAHKLAHELKAQDADAVVTYVGRMPKEFGVTFARAACLRDTRLIMAPAFREWTKNNASLMAALGIQR